MFENNRDEINFHKFLKSVRKSQGVTLEKTTFGVCTKSGMSRVESGNRLPEKLVRDRLTARLGISGEEYEEYLLPNEYRQWQLRMEIIRCINKKDIQGAEEKITAYAESYKTNRVERQFVATMTFMVSQLKGCSDDELRVQIKDALFCTVPNIDAAFDGIQLLADQELNLIMEYVRLAEAPENIEETPTEWRLKEYHKIITYVENSRMDKIAQAKVYSKVACFISDLILKEYTNEESLRYALKLCTRSIEVLRDTFRLYYFVELNEYRMKVIEKLGTYISVKAIKDIEDKEESAAVWNIDAFSDDDEIECKIDCLDDEGKILEKLYHISKEWATLFHELYTENDLPVYMENFTYLYTETECNNAVEVIRKRRAMMGVTRAKFCRNACSERTLQRIELEKNNSSMATVRDVFDKIGICAEYKRARVVTSNAEALHLAIKLIVEINQGDYEKAFQTHQKLCRKIDMNVLFNEQEMKRMEANILRGLGRITEEEYREMLVDTIECTLALESLMSKKEKYLTRVEISCVHNLAMFAEGKEVKCCKKYLEDLCNKILEMEDVETAYLCVYEIVMNICADYMGDDGKHIESRAISRKLLKESLRNRRMVYLMNCEYNDLWNYQKIMELNNATIDNVLVHKSLIRGLHLSNLIRASNWKQFFQQKLQNYNIVINRQY